MKRFLSMMLAIVMVISMIPFAASAAEVDSGYASADADASYPISFNAAVDGTLTITVGDGTADWASDVMNFSDWSTSEPVVGKDQASYTYNVTAGTDYMVRIYGPGDPHTAITDVPYSVVFTPASGEEDETITVYGDVIFSGNDVAISGPQGEGANYTPAEPLVQTYTPTADGIMTVYIKSATNGWFYTGENLTGHSGKNAAAYEHEVRAGTTYTIALYAGKNGIADDGVISYEIRFYAKELEAQKEPYIVSETLITEPGDYTVTMEEMADTTVAIITPKEVGVYTITAPAGATIANLGSTTALISMFVDTAEYGSAVEWTCAEVEHEETDTILDENNNSTEITRVVEGQSLMLGIKSEAETVTVNVAKTGDYEVADVELQTYNNKKFPTQYTLPQGAILGDYVDIHDEVTHTAVKGEDGFYHLDSADGDILLVDMDYEGIVLTDALSGGRGTMYAYVYDDNGVLQEKWDIGTACTLYKNNADENGYYPLTDDLIFFYDTYAVSNWVYGIVLEQTEQTNEDVWMYCMRTMKVAEAGSLENPIVYESVDDMIADWTNKEVAGGETIYFQAPLGGETLTINSTPYGAVALVNTKANLAFAGDTYTFEGFADGEVLTVGIWNQNPAAAEVVTLSKPSTEGTLDNPLVYETVEALVADWTDRTVSGGATVYLAAPLGGVSINISSDPYDAVSILDASGNVMVDAYPTGNFTFEESVRPILIGICNNAPDPEAVTLTVVGGDSGSTEVTYVDLVIGNNSVDGKDAHWVYTAAADGVLTLTPGNAIMGPVSYSFTVNGSGPIDMEAGYPTELSIFTGDVVKIDAVGTGYATLSASWNAVGGEGGEGDETGNVLVLGDNDVALDANDQDGETWTFTATEDGTLTATLTHLKYYTPSYEVEGEFDAYEVTGADLGFACGRLMQFMVNGVNTYSNQQAVSVEAGDVVTVQLISNYGYRTEGVIALAMGEGSEGGESAPEGSVDNPIVITELPYAITVDGKHDVFYAYTSEEACTLKITYPQGNYVSGLTDYEKVEEDLYYIANVAAGETVSINPWGNNAGEYVISLMEDDGTALVLGDNDVALEADDQDGETWTFTATEDGTLTATLTYLKYYVESYEVEGEYDAYEVSGAELGFACGRLMQFMVNGVNTYSNQQAVSVEAGDVVTVQLISNYGYRTEGVIALAMGEGSEGGESAPEGSVDNPIVITELPYTITVDGKHDVFYAYTSEEACTLKITYPQDNYVSGLLNYEKDEENLCYIVTVAAGETVSINPWGNNAGEYVITLVEDVEQPDDLGSKNNPIIITECPSETVVGLNADNYENGLWYQYTATADGVLAAECEGAFVNFIINGQEAYWLDTVTAGDVILMNVACYWYEEGLEYVLKLYDPTVAKIGNDIYTDLSSAIYSAESGETITLMVDAQIGDLKLIPGVTLDLNGNTLTANYVSAFKGSNIVDNSADNAGVLMVDPDCMMISANNAQLPIWNGEGYIFTEMVNYMEQRSSNYIVFSPVFEAVANQYLVKGAADSHVRIAIRMTWEVPTASAYQNFIYKDDTVATIIGSYVDDKGGYYAKAFDATIFGDKTDFTMTVVLISDTGVELELLP